MKNNKHEVTSNDVNIVIYEDAVEIMKLINKITEERKEVSKDENNQIFIC